MAVNGVLSSIVSTGIFITVCFYLLLTYYLLNGSTIVNLRNDYENVYTQIISGGGKPCAPGELGFATYVKWDSIGKKFVKMCVYPASGETVTANRVNNYVVIVPSG